MADDLTEIKERLDVCEAELEGLLKLEGNYLQNNLDLRAFTFNEHIEGARETHYSASIRKPVPTIFRSKAGTIANEIRSCLDELASRLAARNGAKRLDDVHFPIFASEAVFKDLGLKKRIKELSPHDKSEIEKLKPWKGGNDILYRLSQIDNMRKHLRLTACMPGTRGISFGDGFVMIGKLAVVSELIEVGRKPTLIAVGKEVYGDILFIFRITFREPEAANGKIAADCLKECLEEVRRVIALFEPQLSP